jgi:hypothetical protein
LDKSIVNTPGGPAGLPLFSADVQFGGVAGGAAFLQFADPLLAWLSGLKRTPLVEPPFWIWACAGTAIAA